MDLMNMTRVILVSSLVLNLWLLRADLRKAIKFAKKQEKELAIKDNVKKDFKSVSKELKQTFSEFNKK